MRWLVFGFFAFCCLALEVSIRNTLSLGNVSPSFMTVLAVFVALFAQRQRALWGCWILGLAVDLCLPLPHGADQIGPLLGPHALGYTFGCYLLLQVRAMLFRQRAVTLAVMTFAFFVAATIVILAIYSIHSWYETEQIYWTDLSMGSEFIRRLGVGLYSALLAMFLGRLLVWTIPLWSFQTGQQRTGAWR